MSMNAGLKAFIAKKKAGKKPAAKAPVKGKKMPMKVAKKAVKK